MKHLLQLERVRYRNKIFWLAIHKFVALCILLGYDVSSFAQDVREISPITDRILMLHFDEGHIDYTGIDVSEFRNFTIYTGLLNTTNADNKSNYTIKSSDDGNFGPSGKVPLNIGRKSKMEHVGNMFEASVPDYLRSHFIYLQLPHALVPGKTYTLALNNLASNSNEWTFVYDPVQLRSETIHVSQVGFRPNAKKYAYLSQYMGSFNAGVHLNGGLNLNDYSSTNFRLVNGSTGATVFTGNITLQKSKTSADSQNGGQYGPNSNFTNADVWQCDFSSFSTPGYYKIVVDRMGSSYPFEIKDDVYREAYYTAMRSLFFQRAGIYKELKEHNNLVYPASHVTNKMYYRDAGRGEYQEPTDLSKQVTGIWGWYFDAGDWDGIFPTHAKVPALMLLIYDMNPSKFRDGDVGNRWKRNETDPWINEGTNGIPDILDEAKWLIDFMKRARERLQASGNGTGGVPSYVGVDAGAINGKSSWTDTRNLNVTRQDAGVTAMHAGLSGWLSACLAKAGRPQSEIDYYKNEAISAYTWAKNNGAMGGDLQFGATGVYRATGTSSYQTDYINAYNVGNWEYWAAPEWDQLASCMYAIMPDTHPNLNTSHRTTVRNSIKAAADNFWVNNGMTRGFRATHIANGQANFLGIFGTPRTLMQAVTHHVSNNNTYLDATQFAADYALGGNQMNMVWMSGFGHRFDEQPFHPDSWYLIDYNDKVYTNPILPGYVTYGTHYDCDFFGCGWSWEGDEDFSRSSAFPALTNSSYFPQSEGRFFNRVNIPGSEFTIHQNTLHAIFTYGYLTSSTSTSFTPNQRPTVSLDLGQTIGYSCAPLRVTASSDTREVHYYYEWHFIGKSTDKANNFLLNWDISKYSLSVGQTIQITAVGYDDKGLNTVPTASGKKTVTIVSGSTCTNVAVTSIGVSPTTASISAGATQQITATVLPQNATNKTVTWTSSNPSVATVNSTGLVTAVAAGTSTITATTQDGNKTASTSITVTAAAGFTLTINSVNGSVIKNPNKPTYNLNEQVILTANANSGYTFSGWSGGASGTTNPLTVTMNSSKTITANFTQISGGNCSVFQTETGFSGSGAAVASGNGSTGSGYVDFGGQGTYAQWTVNVSSAGSYILKFKHANGSSGNRQCALTANGTTVGNISFAPTANWQTWENEQITATLNAGNNTIRLTANTSAGGPNIDTYEVCGSGTPVTTYTLSISSPNGTVSQSPNKSAYLAGESVTLTATANSGYAFNSWSGGATGSTNPVTITMNSNKSVTANFTQIVTPTCNTSEGETGYTGNGVATVSGNGSTGSGYVDFGGQGTYAQWTVNVPSAGSYTLKFKYANGSSANRQCALTANGATVGNVSFAPAADWVTWRVQQITASLNAGNNTIRLTANTSAGGPNVDSYEVCTGSTAQAASKSESLVVIDKENSDSDGLSFNVFPNPVEGELNVTVESNLFEEETTSLYLIDALGRVLYLKKLDHQQSRRHVVNCTDFPQGMYVIKLQNRRGQKSLKIFIQ